MRRVNQQVQNQTILFRIKSLQMSNEPFSSLIISLLIIWLIRRWFFFLRGIRKGGEVDWLVWLSEGKVWYWPKVFARACMRAPVLTSFVFCCHKCHSGWNWKYFIIPKTTYRFTKNIVSFCWKQRVVLWKVTCRFIENNVSFCGKWRVVLDLRSKSCFEDGVLGIFWGGVVAWKCDSVGCCFWNQCKWLLHNGL